MPFRLIPKERAEELFAKKGNFRLIADLFPLGVVEYYPDCWTEGVSVVVAEINTEKVIAYWASSRLGGYWSYLTEERCEEPYLFKRRSSAQRRMKLAGEVVNLRPHGQQRREGRIAVWWAGDDLNLPEYRQISGGRFPGCPTK